MNDTIKIRIGMMSTRELEFEMDGESDVGKALDKALDKGEPVLWLTDVKGMRRGVLLEKVAFVEIEKPEKRDIGFG